MGEQEIPSSSLRVLQLLVVALVLGVVIFAGIAMVVAPAGTTANLAPLRMALYATLGGCVVASVIVRQKFLRGPAGPSPEHERNPYADPPHPGERTADRQVPQRFFMGTILGCALMESVALYGVILYLLTADPVDLVAAGIPLLLMIVGFFPTEARLRRFVE